MAQEQQINDPVIGRGGYGPGGAGGQGDRGPGENGRGQDSVEHTKLHDRDDFEREAPGQVVEGSSRVKSGKRRNTPPAMADSWARIPTQLILADSTAFG